jgi:hypothetical protein
VALRRIENPIRAVCFGYVTIIAALSAAIPSGNALAAVTISSSATQNMKCSAGVCSPTQANAVLSAKHLQDMLVTGDVEVTTGSGSRASEVQNIVVAAPITWTSANTLTLNAYQSITVEKPVSDEGTGGLTLTTNDGGGGGQLSFSGKGNIGFLATSNTVMINGAVYTLVDNIATLASDIAATPSGNYALANDYDAKPDGTYSSSPVPTTFSGNFNGFGHAILNLVIDDMNEDATSYFVGFFAELGGSGSVENVGLKNVKVSGEGQAQGVGGLLGYNEGGTLFGDYVAGSVFGRGGPVNVGGLVGINGGLGVIGALVSHCYSNAMVNIDVEASEYPATSVVGGLAGSNNDGTITESYSTGRVTAGGKGRVWAGGLVGGETGGGITNSYSMGNISAPRGYPGGLVGIVELDENYQQSAFVSNSYSTGSTGGGSGFINVLTNAGAADDYWDTVTSGTTEGTGSGNVSGVTGLTTAQFQSGLPSGFDPSIWTENSSVNGGLPYLLALPPP